MRPRLQAILTPNGRRKAVAPVVTREMGAGVLDGVPVDQIGIGARVVYY
jgi:hypothetical protein